MRVSVLVALLASASAQSTCAALKTAYKTSECCGADATKSTPYKVKMETKRALLVIDTQYCFLETSTTLPVADSLKILPVLNDLRSTDSDFFSMHVRSQDFHPSSHISFGPTFNLDGFYNAPIGIPMLCTEDASPDACCPMLHPDHCPSPESGCPSYDDASIEANPACGICFPEGPYSLTTNPECKQINQAMWPDHCKSPFEGGDAGFPSDLVERSDDIILRKGQAPYIDGYSAFQDNAGFVTGTGFEGGFDFNLHQKFQAAGIEEVYVVGLAYDYCVAWTAKDAASLGYKVTVIEDGTAFIFESQAALETAEMLALNVTIEQTLTRRRRVEERRLIELQALETAGVKRVQSHEILKFFPHKSAAK